MITGGSGSVDLLEPGLEFLAPSPWRSPQTTLLSDHVASLQISCLSPPSALVHPTGPVITFYEPDPLAGDVLQSFIITTKPVQETLPY